MQLRITNYDSKGNEFQTEWEFIPLRDPRTTPQRLRDDRTDSEGSPLRRPYAKQIFRKITFGAGLLSVAGDKLELLLDAHKIEFGEKKGQKTIWTEYTPDVASREELAILDEIDELVFKEIVFVETKPRYFHTWYK